MLLSGTIREVRGARRREEMAVLCGVSLATVIRWEDGTTVPSDYRHVEALVREGVPLDAIVAALDARVAS